MTDTDLTGLTAIITGAAAGIGKAIAEDFAQAGANLGLCDLNQQKLEIITSKLKESGTQVISCSLDVSDEKRVLEFVLKVKERFGGVDILVNNAGVYLLKPMEEITEAEWDRVMAINLKGYFFFTKAVIGMMREKGFGRIINISSAAGKHGGTVCGLHYASSKGAILSFTRHLAKEFGQDGITVNCVTPAGIATDMVLHLPEPDLQKVIQGSSVKRLGTPEDVAYAVHFLAGKSAGYITGETLNVNGGSIMD